MNCPTCRHVNPTGQRFCGECGARLDAASAGVIATERSYTPAHLAQKILQSRSALEGERKLVTILFCDIADSTPLAARIGPDRMHKLLNSFFETALAEVHRFEGTVNQFLGDGFMALFGAPIAHEDHARRAALAALAIRKAIASDRQFQARDIALKTRIGLNTGAVVVGGIGDNLRMDYTAIGDTTNVAARIQGVAEPGTILASNAVVRAAGEHVEWRAMGLHSLKGKTDSITLHELIGERSHRSRSTHRADAALIGRQAELQAIDQCLEQVGAGRGGVLAIVGEAGLGKSRLLEEAARGGAECGLRVLRGSCLSFGRTLSYWSFREVVREGFGIGDADSDATSWGKLDAGMTRLFADGANELVPYVGTLLALALPEALARRIGKVDGLSMGHQIFRSTLLLFERLAQERPTAVVLEDWHWADASSAELLQHLLPLADRVPLLYVLATRPEPQGAASSLNKALTAEDRTVQQVRILALAPLATEQSAELAEQLLGGGALPSEVRDLLLRRSGGNPFYLGELVRTLIGTKGIERDMLSGNWRTTDQYGAVPLPDTIEGVILARIDRLEDEVKQVLKAAAVVGRTFFYRVLKAVTVANAALDDDLSKLRGAELIDEKQLMPELEYVFKHPLIQQATYDSMLEDRRRELHRQVGASIEQLFAERLEPFYSMLAYHYAKAEDWTKGREYLFKAAEHADRLAADEEALELYSALIAEADHLPHGGVSSLERAELEMKIGDAHFRAGRFRAARAALAGALHRVGMPLPRSRFQLGFSVMVGLARHLMARFDGREEVAEKSPMTTGKQIGCQLLDRLALIDFFIDPLAYVCDGLQMSRLSSAHPSTSWHTLSLSHVGLSFDALGLYRAADRYHKRSRALAARFGDATARGMADYFDSLHHHVIGEWAIARERGEGAADLLLEAGSTRFWAGAMANRVLILRCMGLPQWMSSALEIAKTAAETNDQQALGWATSAVALAQCDRGEHELSYATMERAVNLFRAVPDSRLLAFALGVQSVCLRWLDRLDEAIAHAAEAQVLIQRNRFTGTWVTPPILAAADNYLVVFEAGDSVQRTKMRDATLKAVKAMLRQGRNVRDESPVEAQRVAGTFAWLCGNQRGALAHWSKGLDEAKALGAPHAEARVLFERGQRMNCAHDVQQALQLFVASRTIIRSSMEQFWV